MSRKFFLSIILMLSFILLAACASQNGGAAPTEMAVIPTETPRPTFTPEPTATKTPTPTPIPEVMVTPPASPIAIISRADHFNFYENAGKSYEGGVVDTAREAACYYMLFLKLQSRPLFTDFIASMEEFRTRLVNGEEGSQYQKPSCIVGEFQGEQTAALLTWTAPDGNVYLAGDFTPDNALNDIFTWLSGNHTEEINLGNTFETPKIVFGANGYPHVVLTNKNGGAGYVVNWDGYTLGDAIEDHLMQIDDEGNIGWKYSADKKMWVEKLPSSVNDPRVIQERDEAIAKWQTVLDDIDGDKYTYADYSDGEVGSVEGFLRSYGPTDYTEEVKKRLLEADANTIGEAKGMTSFGVVIDSSELEDEHGRKSLILHTLIKDDENQWVSIPFIVAIQPEDQAGASCWIIADGGGGSRSYEKAVNMFEQRLKNGPVFIGYDWAYALGVDGQHSVKGMRKLTDYMVQGFYFEEERIIWKDWAKTYSPQYPPEFATDPRITMLADLEQGVPSFVIAVYDIAKRP